MARANPAGVLLGYFFGPRRREPASIEEVTVLAPQHAVLVGRFGHLGIAGGTWPLLGRASGWDRSTWPTPVFVRCEELTGRAVHVRYDDDDPNRVIGETPIRTAHVEQGPQDGLMGAGFVEIRLTRLLQATR